MLQHGRTGDAVLDAAHSDVQRLHFRAEAGLQFTESQS
jgi:hypothetical protein